MTKQWLVEDFCPLEHYQCLMPVEYEAIERDGVVISYQKKRMACRNAKSNSCEHAAECSFFRKAPETLEKNANWYQP